MWNRENPGKEWGSAKKSLRNASNSNEVVCGLNPDTVQVAALMTPILNAASKIPGYHTRPKDSAGICKRQTTDAVS